MPDGAAANPAALEAVAAARRAMVGGLALWREGLTAESDAYRANALRLALGAWAPVDTGAPAMAPDSAPGPVTDLEPALKGLERGGYERIDRLRTALAIAAPSNKAVDWIWDEIDRLCRFTLRRLMPHRARRRRRLYAGASLAALIVVVLTFVKLWRGPLASASGALSSEQSASNAIDGMVATEWLLPDRTPGWLQITFRSPREVRSVRLFNAHDKYHLDRASERVRVIAFSDRGPVATAEGRFDRVNIERSALDLPLVADHVTHLRVEVLSYFRTGGGLAEVEVR